MIDDTFDKKELKYMLLRFNNDFFDKCLFEKEVQTLIDNGDENMVTDLLVKHFGICRYGIKSNRNNHTYVIESNGKGIKITDGTVKKGIIFPWPAYAGYLLKFISEGTYYSKKEDGARVFFPFLYEMFYEEKNSISLQIGSKNDLKSYFFTFFDFIRTHHIFEKILKQYTCNSNEDIKNRLLFDKNFEDDMFDIIMRFYNDEVFNFSQDNHKNIQKAQNSLVLIKSIERIKDILDIKNVYLRTKFKINDVHYIFSDIVDSKLVLTGNDTKAALTYKQFSKLIAKGNN